MSKQNNFGGYTLYRIYYDDVIVYLGRTMQPLRSRIRGHLFKKPMHRAISIDQVSKIEYATFQSEADMFLYEIYYINLWKPALNRDDKAPDALSVSLPDVSWQLFSTHLWEKWKNEIAAMDAADEERRRRKSKAIEEDRCMRQKRRNGEITESEYWEFWERTFQSL